MSAGVAILAVGKTAELVGTLREGAANASAADYNADVAEQNAQLAEMQSAEEERRARIRSKKELGDIRANYGASGVQLEGSPLDVLESSAMNAELDALSIRHQGQIKSQLFRNEALLERYKARNLRTNTKFKSVAGLLGLGGGIASSLDSGGGSGGSGGGAAGGAAAGGGV